MENCVFCDIASYKQTAHVVYKDEKYIAFLDKYPRAKGHTLVVPRKHYRRVDEVEEFGEYMEVARKIGKAIGKAFSVKWMQYFSIGEEVAHAHVHVFPRYKGDKHGALPNLLSIEKYSDTQMIEIAKQIRKEIGKK